MIEIDIEKLMEEDDISPNEQNVVKKQKQLAFHPLQSVSRFKHQLWKHDRYLGPHTAYVTHIDEVNPKRH